MGGCRCSYRNCSARSGEKTHLFHYPVYDKVRCHQWIVNSRRFEFFNLTVSQVRNRVVCQHHFKEKCFMNYKKEKLTFESIPTEDGPYCDSSKEEEINELDEEKAISVLNDIETEPSLYLDKRAKSSLKYKDFLANCDAEWQQIGQNYFIMPPCVYQKDENVTKSQLETFQELIKVNKSSKKDKKSYTTDNKLSKEKECLIQYDTTLQTTDNVKDKILPINEDCNVMVTNNNELTFVNNSNMVTYCCVPNTSIDNVVTSNLTQSIIVLPPINSQGADLNETGLIDNQQNQLIFNDAYSTNHLEHAQVPGDSKVKILSEKTILEPLSFVGKLKSVSPSLILRVPNRKNEKLSDDPQNSTLNNKLIFNTIEEITTMNFDVQQLNNSQIVSSEDLTSNNIVLVEPPKIEIEVEPEKNGEIAKYVAPQKVEELEISVEKSFTHNNFNSRNKSKSHEPAPKMSMLKSKISPERLADIEKKRSFNKKLRDIVESCLEKSDEQETVQDTTNILKARDAKNVGVFLSKHNALPGTQEYTLSFLEARMNKMENVLLKKIEQNSNRILDLKNCVAPRKRKSAYTQTSYNEDSHKKHLYQEISKFLSPSAKSLVFEELFIKKYAQKESDCKPTPKRKRCR